MPNGLTLNKDTWEKLEVPLIKIDSKLKYFANKNKLSISMNYHNWPDRTISWKNINIEKHIYITLKDEKNATYNIGIWSNGIDNKKLFKHIILKKNVHLDETGLNLNKILNHGYNILNKMNLEDLIHKNDDNILKPFKLRFYLFIERLKTYFTSSINW